MSFFISIFKSMSAADYALFALMGVFVLSACRILNRDISLAGVFLAIAFPAGAFLFMLIPVGARAGAAGRSKAVSGACG